MLWGLVDHLEHQSGSWQSPAPGYTAWEVFARCGDGFTSGFSCGLFLVHGGIQASEPKDSASASVLMDENSLLTTSFRQTRPVPARSHAIAPGDAPPAVLGWWDGKVSSVLALDYLPAPAQPASPPQAL